MKSKKSKGLLTMLLATAMTIGSIQGQYILQRLRKPPLSGIRLPKKNTNGWLIGAIYLQVLLEMDFLK